MVNESDIERKLKKSIENLGGLAWKWVSPGQVGVPDRIIMVGGQIYLVELKTETGRLSPIQIATHNKIRKAGCNPITLYGMMDVERFVEEIKQYGV